MGRKVHIVIAEPSLIIRNGMVSVLKRLSPVNIDIAEISDMTNLISEASKLIPDILIINPSHIGIMPVETIKNEMRTPKLKIVALQNSLSETLVLNQYDEIITIYDSSDIIKEKITKLTSTHNGSSRNEQELSKREKEVVICVVKGMTNKQIAEKLFLSTHTIMTHRKNIVNKLQIHSTSGLTIYAIITKLVMIDEVKNTIFDKKK